MCFLRSKKYDNVFKLSPITAFEKNKKHDWHTHAVRLKPPSALFPSAPCLTLVFNSRRIALSPCHLPRHCLRRVPPFKGPPLPKSTPVTLKALKR